MQIVTVGIADCRVSANPEDVLVTYALGSCIAVAIYDAEARVAGLLHFMLPDSLIDVERARKEPYMFADTGVPLLFREAYRLGAEKRRLTVRLAGGAQVMDDRGVFDIGRRNYLAIRKMLWKAGVLVHTEAVGGTVSRTVRLEVSTGTAWVREGVGAEEQLGGTPAVRKERLCRTEC